MGNKVTLIHGTNWSAMYLNGSLCFQDVTLTASEALRAVFGTPVHEIHEITLTEEGDEWIDTCGAYPDHLSEIPENFVL